MKNKRLNIRLTETEYNRLKGYAQQHNLTVTEYVKSCTGLIYFANLKDVQETTYGNLTNLDTIMLADAIKKEEWQKSQKQIEEAEWQQNEEDYKSNFDFSSLFL